MLTLLGYSVHTVPSGEEAVRYMEENEAALLLLDMVMRPGINGRVTYEKIIAMHPEQKTIIVSGFSETEEVKKVKELGVDLFLKKPFRSEGLARAIKQVLQ
jgi:DNA-binding NarL/FixJ family response regulator